MCSAVRFMLSGSSCPHSSGCGGIGEQVQRADRAQARGRQGGFAALKPAEDLPLFFPRDEERHMPAALEGGIGERDAGGLGSDDCRHPSFTFLQYAGTREQRCRMPVWAQSKEIHIE